MSLEYEIPKTFEDIESLTQWVWQQLKRTEEEFNLGRDAFYLDVLHAEPPKPRNGMIVRADGTDWNPDSTVNPDNDPGYWAYEDGQWILFSRTGAPLDPSIPNDFVTFAQIQNIATDRVLGRDTAGSGDIEELTLSQVLDFIGSAAQGDILYRGNSAWARLGAGTSGQFLQTQGTGANPQWASAGGLTLLTSGTPSNVATLDLVLTSYTGYRGFKLFGSFLPATDGASLTTLFSTNGGSSYDASGYSYARVFVNDAGASGVSNNGSTTSILLEPNIGNGTQEGTRVELTILNPFSTSLNTMISAICATRTNAATPASSICLTAGCREAAQDTDAFRLLFSSGNIAEANYALYGIS